jgi:hypothetical protein
VCFNIILLIISSVIYRIDQRITGVKYQLNHARVLVFKESLNPPTIQQQLLLQLSSVVNTLSLLAQHKSSIRLPAAAQSLKLNAYASTTHSPAMEVSCSSPVRFSPKEDQKIDVTNFRGQMASIFKSGVLKPSEIKKRMADAAKASNNEISPSAAPDKNPAKSTEEKPATKSTEIPSTKSTEEKPGQENIQSGTPKVSKDSDGKAPGSKKRKPFHNMMSNIPLPPPLPTSLPR